MKKIATPTSVVKVENLETEPQKLPPDASLNIELNKLTIVRDHSSVDPSPLLKTQQTPSENMTLPSKRNLLSPSALKMQNSSKLSNISRDRAYAYPDMNLAQVTQKAKYRELYTEHFDAAKKATVGWKPHLENVVEHEGKKITKFTDVAEFVDVKMQTAIRGTYDYDMSLDENLNVYVN